MSETCETCRFWQYIAGEDGLELAGKLRAVGKCRIRAPICHPNHVMGEWPTTFQIDWCGEWKPASHAAPDAV